MSSLPQVVDAEHSRVGDIRVGFVTETCPDCLRPVSYELGPGNPVCVNKDCVRYHIPLSD